MSNPVTYVRFDQATWEKLQKLAQAERRSPGDQTAILVKEALEKLEKLRRGGELVATR